MLTHTPDAEVPVKILFKIRRAHPMYPIHDTEATLLARREGSQATLVRLL